MNDESILSQFETVAKKADAQAAMADEFQNSLDEMDEITDLTSHYIDKMIAKGIPVPLAHTMASYYVSAYWQAKQEWVWRA